jgi:hypothetical protein
MFGGVEIGLTVLPVGPLGCAPQVSRTASFGGPLFVFETGLLPPLEGEEVAGLPPEDAVPAPVGFEVVGTMAGTEVHALSKTSMLTLDCGGTSEAATGKSMHTQVVTSLSSVPKPKERQEASLSHCPWHPCAVSMPVG